MRSYLKQKKYSTENKKDIISVKKNTFIMGIKKGIRINTKSKKVWSTQ
jgi:hypothetical protein